tara:strand:- start:103 stop:711 length:609 start_codon:yes stop_codon:yes gene_type:complete
MSEQTEQSNHPNLSNQLHPHQSQVYASKHILSIVQKECQKVINKISHHYGLDSNELLNMCLPKSVIIDETIIKKRNRRTLKASEMCMGRKLDNNQCTRRRLNGKEFCKSHLKNLPQGRIDEDEPVSKTKGKRGRKRKNCISDKHNNDDYIAMWEEIIGDGKYLIDIYNNVYTNNVQTPKFLGKKTIQGDINYVTQPLIDVRC